MLFWKRIFSQPTFKIFFYLSVLLWKYFDSGGKICCLWRKHFFLSGVDIFCSYCSNVHTSDEIFPHKRRNISTQVTKYFHTRDEIFRNQRRIISTPVWKVCVHAGRAGLHVCFSLRNFISTSTEYRYLLD